jgi:SAM-dependent methyltransferase
VGVDISDDELAAAPAGSYDAVLTADLVHGLALGERFDVALSWQVLEHVESMSRALASIKHALDPGGRLLAQVSGGRSAFALAARLIPASTHQRLLSRLLGEPKEAHFPTRYNACTASALGELMESWASAEIIPYFRGATYFDFNRLLRAAYLAFENRLAHGRWADYATHYLVIAER